MTDSEIEQIFQQILQQDNPDINLLEKLTKAVILINNEKLTNDFNLMMNEINKIRKLLPPSFRQNGNETLVMSFLNWQFNKDEIKDEIIIKAQEDISEIMHTHMSKSEAFIDYLNKKQDRIYINFFNNFLHAIQPLIPLFLYNKPDSNLTTNILLIIFNSVISHLKIKKRDIEYNLQNVDETKIIEDQNKLIENINEKK